MPCDCTHIDCDCAVFGLETYLLPCVFLCAKVYVKMYSQNAWQCFTQIVFRQTHLSLYHFNAHFLLYDTPSSLAPINKREEVLVI